MTTPNTTLAILAALAIQASAAQAVYEMNFEKSPVDSLPDEFLVLNGAFAVRQEGQNKFLELPGAPLESFGVLFGPTEKEGLAVSARIFGTSKGRRAPTFAVGLNGVAGYRLQVSPAKKMIELYRSDQAVHSVPHEWASGTWTRLALQVQRLANGKWKITGKVWADGQEPPASPTIEWEESEEPFAGRASVWGSPFAGTPIRFDDFVVKTTGQ